MKRAKRERPTRPRPMALRSNAQRQMIARLLLLGWTGERIARRLGCTSRAVRYAIATAEFETLFTTLQREQLKTLDQKMSRLLHGAVKALAKMLKHPDWRARDAAAEKILKMHGRYMEKLNVTGALDHTGAVHHLHQHQLGLVPADDMTPEQRSLAVQLLRSYRATQPTRALPPAFTPGLSQDDSH